MANNEIEKHIKPPIRSLYHKIIYNLFINLIFFIIFLFIFILIFKIDQRDIRMIMLILIFISPIFLSLIFHIFLGFFNIIRKNTKEYFFYSDRIVEKYKNSPYFSQSFFYKDIKEVELIQDDIISKFLGMEIIGIHAKEDDAVKAIESGDRSWFNKSLSSFNFIEILRVIFFFIGSRGKNNVKKNPIIRTGINKATDKYYQILIILPKNEVIEIKNFIDQKLKT